MARSARPLNTAQLAAVAVAATWTAGFVDTIGFLLLSNILTANMSGNTVHIGVSAVTANAVQALRRGWPILMFVAGLIVSAIIHEAGARRRFLSTSAITFCIEAGLLGWVQFLYVKHWPDLLGPHLFLISVASLAFAMGMQNATVTRVGALSVKTTHVTGTLTQFAEGLSLLVFWGYDRLSRPGAHRVRRVLLLTPRQKSFRQARLMLLLWIAFALGAISGATTRALGRRYLLLPPLFVTFALLVLDVVRPIAASDEHRALRKSST